jgi:uncharacterized protein YukE
MTDWTAEMVLISEPAGATGAATGFAGMAAIANQLASIVTDLGKVPWQGEAAAAFRAYLAGLHRSVQGAGDIAQACGKAADDAGAGLTALMPAAEDTANRLNALIDRAAAINADGVGFIEAIELARMRVEAQQSLARVRAQREEVLAALSAAMAGGIDELLGFRAPQPPDPAEIADPTQRDIVRGLVDEVDETMAEVGDTDRARAYLDQLNATDNEEIRRQLLRRAADELSAAELDHLLDNMDPDELSAALDAGPWIFDPSNTAAQRELYNAIAMKLDMDSLTGLAELVPDDYWHPDPYREVPGLGGDFQPEGWNLAWDPLPGAGEEVTPESINPEDVQQRGLGDCHLQATLYSLASTEEGRQLLADNITRNENGTYTVTLYDRDGNPVPVVVTPDTPVARTDDGWESTYDDNRANWVQLYEKAVAQSNGELSQQDPLDRAGQNQEQGYPGINGGWPQENFSRITGNEPPNFSNSDAGDLGTRQVLQAAEQGNAPITVTFNEDVNGVQDYDGGDATAHGAHVYSVDSVDWSAEPPVVHLRNPWGFDHVVMTLDQLQGSNGYLTVGQVD